MAAGGVAAVAEVVEDGSRSLGFVGSDAGDIVVEAEVEM